MRKINLVQLVSQIVPQALKMPLEHPMEFIKSATVPFVGGVLVMLMTQVFPQLDQDKLDLLSALQIFVSFLLGLYFLALFVTQWTRFVLTGDPVNPINLFEKATFKTLIFLIIVGLILGASIAIFPIAQAILESEASSVIKYGAIGLVVFLLTAIPLLMGRLAMIPAAISDNDSKCDGIMAKTKGNMLRMLPLLALYIGLSYGLSRLLGYVFVLGDTAAPFWFLVIDDFIAFFPKAFLVGALALVYKSISSDPEPTK